jgi:hypothetical protein
LALLSFHLACTAAMMGVIWFVQLVHYPIFPYARNEFPPFAEQHGRRTTWVVAPLMFGELGSGLWLWVQWGWAGKASLWILGAIWLSTFAVQVPLHEKLRGGFEEKVWRKLLRSNWLRTFLWSLRVVLVMMEQEKIGQRLSVFSVT